MAIPLLLSVAGSARHIVLGVAAASSSLSRSSHSGSPRPRCSSRSSSLRSRPTCCCAGPPRGCSRPSAISLAGGACSILGVEQQDALDSGVVTPAALEQGDEMTLMLIVVCAGVASCRPAARYSSGSCPPGLAAAVTQDEGRRARDRRGLRPRGHPRDADPRRDRRRLGEVPRPVRCRCCDEARASSKCSTLRAAAGISSGKRRTRPARASR